MFTYEIQADEARGFLVNVHVTTALLICNMRYYCHKKNKRIDI